MPKLGTVPLEYVNAVPLIDPVKVKALYVDVIVVAVDTALAMFSSYVAKYDTIPRTYVPAFTPVPVKTAPIPGGVPLETDKVVPLIVPVNVDVPERTVAAVYGAH